MPSLWSRVRRIVSASSWALRWSASSERARPRPRTRWPTTPFDFETEVLDDQKLALGIDFHTIVLLYRLLGTVDEEERLTELGWWGCPGIMISPSWWRPRGGRRLMDTDTMRRRVAAARVGRLATFHPKRGPHLVPVTYALDGETIVTAVDHKPKRTNALQRLANIEAEPRVCLLIDQYDPDWTRLWWVRIDGRARIVADGPDWQQAVDLLVQRYEQYRQRPPAGPAILIWTIRWQGWAA